MISSMEVMIESADLSLRLSPAAGLAGVVLGAGVLVSLGLGSVKSWVGFWSAPVGLMSVEKYELGFSIFVLFYCLHD